MELAISAITSLFGGGGAAATVAVPGIAGASTLVPASAGLSGAQFLTTALSALGTIGSGITAAAASKQEADAADLQAGQEKVLSEQRVTQMKRSLLSVIADNAVSFASAGIDLGQGIAADSAANAKKRASEEISIDRRDQEFRSALYRLRASNLRTRGVSQAGGALLGAIGDFADFGLNQRRRGIVL